MNSAATEKWKAIARLAGREPHEEARKHWLSNLDCPWLLIIENADHTEESVRSHFPTGERGSVLITTRNPRIQIENTVGHLSLEKLEADEANDLLRKTSNHTPWDDSAKSSAASIARSLAYLPLALIHGGRAIFHNFCSLQNYIPFFNKTLDDFRVRSPALLFHSSERLGIRSVFRSFAVIYSGLEALAYGQSEEVITCQDALELVNMFSFFHCNDITLLTLVRAGDNLHTSASLPRQEEHDATKSSVRERLKNLVTALVVKLQHQAVVLPQLFKRAKSLAFDEACARQAIDTLVSMSLISESSSKEAYSMHPLLHLWVRKRLRVAEQALWCQAAANVLASSVKIPPLVDEESDSGCHMRILPHIEQVQLVQVEIKDSIQQKRKEAGLLRQILQRLDIPIEFTALDAANCARYSRIYLESAKYEEAEVLQRRVRDFLIARLGRKHLLSVRIEIFLSSTLWHLGKTDEAFNIQQDTLKICRETLKESHPVTLRVMDSLGEICWQRGLLREAKELHEQAVAGMEKRPDMLRDKLKAIDHLGRVHAQYFEYDIAKTKHEEVVNDFDDISTLTISTLSLPKTIWP